MVRVKRKIISAEVTIVALCKRGANTLRTLYKSASGARLMAMTKASETFEEKGQLFAVVAVPGLDFSADQDGNVDVIESAAAIEKAAHGFMRHGAALDMRHNLKPLGKDKAFVAESFVIQKGDPRFAGWKTYSDKVVDVTGGWGMVIQIDDPTLRKSYRDGEWDGVSLFAPDAEIEPLEKATNTELTETLRNLFKDAGLIASTDEESDDMTEEQMKALAKMLVEALKPAPAVEADDKGGETNSGDAIPFVGNPTVKADLVAHSAKVKAAALAKSGDLNDPAKIAALIKEIEDAELDPKAEREALRKSDPARATLLDEKDALEAKLAKLTRTSNQTLGEDKTSTSADSDPLVKRGLIKAEMVPVMAAAKAAAHELNVRLGRVPATAK